MAKKNRKRYQRKLDVGTLSALLLIGAAIAAGACGFVQVKNAHIECADAKCTLEEEIANLERELECVAGRIDTAYDRPGLVTALRSAGSELCPIERAEHIDAGAVRVPAALASLAGPDAGAMILINVENPSG